MRVRLLPYRLRCAHHGASTTCGCSLQTCGCSLHHMWLQPPPHVVAASTTCGCSLHHMRLVAASTTSITYGCSLHRTRCAASTSYGVQPLSRAAAGAAVLGRVHAYDLPFTYYALLTTIQVLLCWGVCMLLPPDDDYEPQRPRRRKDIAMRAEVVRDDHDEQVHMHVHVHVHVAHIWGDHDEQVRCVSMAWPWRDHDTYAGAPPLSRGAASHRRRCAQPARLRGHRHYSDDGRRERRVVR